MTDDIYNVLLSVVAIIVESFVPFLLFRWVKDEAKNVSAYRAGATILLIVRLIVDYVLGTILSLYGAGATQSSSTVFGICWLGMSLRDIVMYLFFLVKVDVKNNASTKEEKIGPVDISGGIFSPDNKEK
jgi:hypothetical protein